MFKRMMVLLIIGLLIFYYLWHEVWKGRRVQSMTSPTVATSSLAEVGSEGVQALVRLDDSGTPLDQPLLRYADAGKHIPIPTMPLKGKVALTFDDGPSPIYTPQVLAILKKMKVTATFFLVGEKVQQYPGLVRDIIAGGHAIGCHGQLHRDLTTLSPAELQKEVQGCQATLRSVTGLKPRCFRPPYNKTNAQVSAYIEAQGMRLQNKAINTWDWENPGVNKIVHCTLCLVRAGSVFIFHDGQLERENHAQTVYVLPEIIRGIQKRGLHFETVC
jgi:peptidoglycan/xylan/chitin deacetylase (PgdA/CDA1 family)